MDIFIIILFTIDVINIAELLLIGIDKRKQEKNKKGIPTIVLLILAIFGGSIGAIAGMILFKNKKGDPLFSVGIPTILFLQILVIFCLILSTAK